MDILGTNRAKLQHQLDQTQIQLSEAHEMLRESHRRFIETLDAAVANTVHQTKAAIVASPSLFSQNRVRKAVEVE